MSDEPIMAVRNMIPNRGRPVSVPTSNPTSGAIARATRTRTQRGHGGGFSGMRSACHGLSLGEGWFLLIERPSTARQLQSKNSWSPLLSRKTKSPLGSRLTKAPSVTAAIVRKTRLRQLRELLSARPDRGRAVLQPADRAPAETRLAGGIGRPGAKWMTSSSVDRPCAQFDRCSGIGLCARQDALGRVTDATGPGFSGRVVTWSWGD